MSKLIIGLTGGIGSGKTTITNIFKGLGIEIIDADIIARDVVSINSPALKAIKEHFGHEFLQSDGHLNRALLRERIFSHNSDKLWLNNLLHPIIRSSIIEQTQSAVGEYCILVAPLLVENNLLALVDRVLVIDVDESTQLKRAMLRDNSSQESIKAIIASQASRIARTCVADDIINNDNASLDTIKQNVLDLDKKYLTLTKMV